MRVRYYHVQPTNTLMTPHSQKSFSHVNLVRWKNIWTNFMNGHMPIICILINRNF